MAEEQTVAPEEAKPPEVKKQEPEIKEPESTPPMYPVEGRDGITREFDQNQIMQLAQMGLDKALVDQEPEPEKEEKKEEEPTVQSLNTKLDKANDEFTQYKAGKEKEAQLHKYKTDLDTAVDGLDMVKEYPSQRNNILTRAAVLMSGQKMSINDAVTQVAKENLDFLKEVEANKNHANTKVRAVVDQVHQGGGAPVLVLDKPRTAESVISGQSRREMAAFLENARET